MRPPPQYTTFDNISRAKYEEFKVFLQNSPMSPGMRSQLKAYLGIDYDEMEARHGALSQELGRITAAIEAEPSSGRKPSGELVQPDGIVARVSRSRHGA